MHLAILMTNTDESAFAQRHPKDGEKFPTLLHLVRPDWTFEVFSVKDGVFPPDTSAFDGVIITGSPASVLGSADWIARLLDLIRDMDSRAIPMFGACFGHQAIARALGGTLGRNPEGWVHGLTHNTVRSTAPWMTDLPGDLKLYGSHVEYVNHPPPGSEIVLTARNGSITGFRIANRVYTTQHHPEMTAGFIAALTEELADQMGPEIADTARQSLSERSDMRPFAESIARFFETALSQRSSEDP